MTNNARSSLADVSTSGLERLRAAVASETLDTPITRTSLVAFGIRHQLDALEGKVDASIREVYVVIPEEARKAGVPPGWLR